MRLDRGGFALSLALVTLFHHAAASAQWSPDGVPVAVVTGYQDDPVAVPDGGGGAFVAWNDNRSTRLVYAQRLDASGVPQWTSNGLPLTGDDFTTNRIPAMVADGQGGAIVAWASKPLSTEVIVVQRLDAAGNRLWAPNGVVVFPSGGPPREYRLVPDGSGGALVFWRDERNDAKGDLYAQRVNATGAIQWDSAGVPICVAANEQMRVTAVASGAGGAIVAWEDYRSGSGAIHAQLVDSSGVAQWTPNGVRVSAPSFQSNPAIVGDGTNGAVLMWVDYRALPDRVMYAQRLNHAGTALWDSGGVALGAPASVASDLCAVSDGAGGAIAAWTGPIGILAQRVDASGTLLYDPSGMRLTDAPGYENTPCVASDGAGGAVVAWRDSRHGSGNTDIYAQRVSAAGVLKWEAEGRAVCTASGAQVRPTIASRGMGSAIIAWSDNRNTVDNDVYAWCPDITGEVSAGWQVPATDRVGRPRPNPTRAGVALDFELTTPQRVSIEVLDVSGRIVRRIEMGRTFAAGSRTVFWDGTSDRGEPVPAGVYGIRVSGSDFRVARRVAVVR